MCLETKETRYFDLYIHGSEGTQLCHNCEMLVVQFIRDEAMTALRKRKADFMARREKSQKGA
jgi:hypothetical protein